MRRKVTKAGWDKLCQVVDELRAAQLPEEARTLVREEILPGLTALIERHNKIEGGPGGNVEL